jgi:glycosyltransferase involved in cell wall biosynthesis
MSQRKIAIVSSEFQGGGAERVLSTLVNNGVGKGFSLSGKVSYVVDKTRVECLIEHRVRLVRWWLKSLFLFRMSKDYTTVIVSDFYILSFLSFLKSTSCPSLQIVYRPSINANYLISSLSIVFGKTLSLFVIRFILRDIVFIYQTKDIELSFVNLGIRELKSLVISNPISGVIFKDISHVDDVFKVFFIGRPTTEKGYDRFLLLASSSEMKDFQFHHYGIIPTESRFKSECVIEHGWKSIADLALDNAVVVVPSRLEGFPNLILELISNGVRPVVSSEIAFYFKDFREIYDTLHIVDFDRVNFCRVVKDIIEKGDFLLSFEEIRMVQENLPTSADYSNIIYKFIIGEEEIQRN